jgi:hypothetical protein
MPPRLKHSAGARVQPGLTVLTRPTPDDPARGSGHGFQVAFSHPLCRCPDLRFAVVERSQHPKNQRKSEFFGQHALDLIKTAIPQSQLWPGSRLSEQFKFYGNDDIVAIIGWPGAGEANNEALAWGMSLGTDRHVVLVLPEERASATLQRLPWIKTDVEVWAYNPTDPAGVVSAAIPSKHEVLGQIHDWGPRGAGYSLERVDDETLSRTLFHEKAAWVESLVGWVNTHHHDLAPRHRGHDLIWKSMGRQVLRISRHRGGLRILAGTRYSKPRSDQQKPPPPLDLLSELTDEQCGALKATIETAITNRQPGGSDGGHEEHRLQHTIQDEFELTGRLFDLTLLTAEFPSWRPGHQPGLIDFLGAAPPGPPHIVETKLDNYLMLTLQGLDYWMWAKANPELVAASLSEQVSGTPVIDFVVGAHKTTTAIGPYTRHQVESLDDEVEWRFHVVKDWRTSLSVITFRTRQMPEVPFASIPMPSPFFARQP